ncbi:L-threonylcarbamoyladenylate synthase [Lacinutrix sp.]|uniref:L-threonylcarbamoyladenylate synthase n=1 Tax=Lacinutrix sp. TaxID=1937692 RepID=UPI0025C14B7A|nr:L-threonylcarbamoyladenylate synthase [Lacinutrix sp.]
MREEIEKTLEVLKRGGIILYPTDTVWGIGCDSGNESAVKKIYKLKQRDDSKALICLVNNYGMLERHVDNVPKMAYTILDIADKPTTIIYDNPAGIAENLVAEDNTLAIRIVDHDFCTKLVRYLGRPLVSTSANLAGKPTPKSFKEIDDAIIKGVDYVVNLHQQKNGGNPSTIIKLSNSSGVKIIRE